jgi:surface antigen (D15)
MPEIKAIKSKPTVNNFDFDFFSDNKGRRGKTTKVAIHICKSYIKLSLLAYQKLKGPEYFKVGIDVKNKVICVTPALAKEPNVIKPTAKQIERNTIFITKSHDIINKLFDLGIPKEVEGKLVDGDLLFKF